MLFFKIHVEQIHYIENVQTTRGAARHLNEPLYLSLAL